ncbi:TPA: hypothetical protein JK846_003632 [Escherichia coli]|nr:hypothetical protein [Escherichia coli]
MRINDLTWRASEMQMTELAHTLLQWVGIEEFRKRMHPSHGGPLRRTGLVGLTRAMIAHDRLITRASVNVIPQ